MPTSRTVTVTADDDCTEADYVGKVALSIKALMLGLPQEVQAATLLRLIQGLDPDMQRAIRVKLLSDGT